MRIDCVDENGRLQEVAFTKILEAASEVFRQEFDLPAEEEERMEVSLTITDEESIRQINREYRDIDRVTDVLSFPLNELTPGEFDPEECERDLDTGAVLLGDMMISVPRCESQGEEFGHGYEREIMYLTVHSVLHLLGYDHVDDGEEKRRMRKREKEIMGDKD